MRRYEYIEHTADIGVRAYGETIGEAFAAVAEAMFALLTDNATVIGTRQVSFTVGSDDRESLLVKFLSQLILVFETENLVLTDFDVSVTGDQSLEARMKGERFDTERHGNGTPVKGVSYHMLEIVDACDDQPASVQVLFDI
jgi:SHS2 domain-containing protein